MESIVVVGASLAGLRAVETLRRDGFDGRLTLVGAEPHLPYDRPPLSKELLAGDWEHDQIVLRKVPYEELDLELRLGVGRDGPRRRGAHGSTLASGTELAFDGLVDRDRRRRRARCPASPTLDGVFTLRTIDDCHAIREPPRRRARSVCVIGAGFIGAEVAATCRKRGPRRHGARGAAAADGARRRAWRSARCSVGLHRDHGVDLRCGVTLESIEGDGPGRARPARRRRAWSSATCCSSRSASRPRRAWLEGSGLALDNGVVCDETLLAAPGVVAAGDVAPLAEPARSTTRSCGSSTGPTRPSRACTSGERLLRGDGDAPPSRSRRCRSSGRTSTT